MSARVRLDDIAKLAGVSPATVSRVINGTGQVRESTAESVRLAMDTLGYDRPSALSRTSLAPVGLILPELTNPVFANYAHHLQLELAHRGHPAFICSQAPGGMTENQLIDSLLSAGCAGLIFVCGRHADSQANLEQYQELLDKEIPFVLINGPRSELAAPSVCVNYDAGMQTAIYHLKQLGHRKIALVCGRDNAIPAKLQRDAYQTYMEKNFGADSLTVIPTFYTFAGGQSAAQEVIRAGATAVIAGSDLQALGVISGATSLGAKVPQDLSVIGFDDSALMTHTTPPLTTLRQPVVTIANAAVQVLSEEISANKLQTCELRFAPDLIQRGSTTPPLN
ncbi:hypothetical protein BK816_06045 [Boudabousia tangfeifanii]|uniref:HTH lacI-type domain-containing protein n=1 Tax=Boudabousia tangfeifanii TaxID=1912795 RepID=A0A1D9MKU9_9ACTO|nr:LacI family DNA-binding transcriptional regulator [Boudabousia tangfeifanii]AOZ72906.1 hypothetical protein BK816_06045 [Boudabousia tangfeifanii]